MSRSEEELKELVKKAAVASANHPTLTIPQAMRVAEFTTEESKDRTLQMRVRRHIKPPPTTVSISKSPLSSISSLETSNPSPPKHPQIKKTRATSAQAQQHRTNKLIQKQHHKFAHKEATSLYHAQKDKPKEEQLSAQQVSEVVLQNTGVAIGVRTIQREVKEGRIGVSPKKGGPPSIFPDEVFGKLSSAFESFIQIKQINGQSGNINNKLLTELLKQCTVSKVHCNCKHLLSRLLDDTAIDLTCGRINNAEERRIRGFNNMW